MFLSKKGVPLAKYHRTSKANQGSKNDNTTMKKQVNPTIKAYLIRGAFYLLLLLAVCAIPFALAQHNAKRSMSSPAVAAKTSLAAAQVQRNPDTANPEQVPGRNSANALGVAS